MRTHLPLVEVFAPEQAKPIQDALAQLQMAFVQASGGTPGPGAGPMGVGADGPAGPGTPGEAPGAEEGTPGQPGPAQKSGRLWIPGQ